MANHQLFTTLNFSPQYVVDFAYKNLFYSSFEYYCGGEYFTAYKI